MSATLDTQVDYIAALSDCSIRRIHVSAHGGVNDCLPSSPVEECRLVRLKNNPPAMAERHDWSARQQDCHVL
jgi:hypothetical protein